ncbi:MAG: TonB-dependent receptor [Candidatus Solibacter usitatus]|nr:TonB-dependent receptor [Candidatus Solibacter usitatus]
MLRSRLLSALLFALALAPSALRLDAQVSNIGRIDGRVQDETGAVIAGATVTVTNTRTQIVNQTTTDASGLFVFAAVPNSVYTLTVESKGFRKAQVANIELSSGTTVTQAVRMEVGAVTETVTVEASTERVNTSDSMIGRTVTLRDMDVLPSIGRSPLAIAIMQPGASVNPADVTFTNINGTRQGSNNTKLDGIDANDAVVPRLGLSLTAVNLDSVEEVRVVTNGGKAEYGRNAGGQVEMITRSGTNRFSGNAYEYLRNTELNANNFFNNASGVARPKLIQNQFGGSLGGPVFRNKTFFFGNYQGSRVRQETVRNRTVFTPEAKAGLFRWRTTAASPIQSFDIVRNDPKNKGIDPAAASVLKDIPNPNNFDVGDTLNTAGFRFNNSTGSLNDQYTFKVDHQLWSNHRIFYRHSWFRTDSIDALNNADARYPGGIQGSQGGIRWGFSIGSDWAIRPNWVNDFRIGYQSASVDFRRPNRPRDNVIDFNLPDEPYLTGFNQGRNSPVIDMANNLMHISGKHIYKFGMTTRRVLQYGYNEAGIFPTSSLSTANNNAPPGTFGPNGAAVISSADRARFEQMYNDILGRVGNVTQTFYSDLEKFQPAGVARIRNNTLRDLAFFAQDDWKIRPGLTLNIGIRWEYFGPPVESDTLQGTIDKAAQISPVANFNDTKVVRQSNWYNKDLNNIAPRFGFAWDPKNDGKMVIRGSYGMFYDRIIGATASLVDGNTPGFSQAVTNFPNSAAGSDVRFSEKPALPAQPGAPILQQGLTRQTTISIFNPNVRTGYVQHFNLSIQRELFRNTILDAGFVRTKGTKLFTWLDYNQPRIYGDFLTAFNQIAAFQANGNTPVPASNTLVRLFGSAAGAVSGIGAAALQQGLVGTAADTVDRNNFTRYAAAGVSDFYLRNYPQYNLVHNGSNNGTSAFNSLQVSLRRNSGSLRYVFNYTLARSIDNSSVDGNGFTAPIDNYNLGLNKGPSDFDRTHSFNGGLTYTLPFGRGKFIGGNMPNWLDKIAAGWDIGTLYFWQSGVVLTASSGRRTTGSTANTWANYSGDRTIGEVVRQGNGVFFWNA